MDQNYYYCFYSLTADNLPCELNKGLFANDFK